MATSLPPSGCASPVGASGAGGSCSTGGNDAPRSVTEGEEHAELLAAADGGDPLLEHGGRVVAQATDGEQLTLVDKEGGAPEQVAGGLVPAARGLSANPAGG